MRPGWRVVFIVTLLVTMGFWALGGAASADDGIQCGSVITEDTVLTHDLLDCENGLVIGAPNVTLDLGGHRVVGRGTGTGIELTVPEAEAHSSTVRNGSIRSFGIGVSVGSSFYPTGAAGMATLSNLNIASNGTGIWVHAEVIQPGNAKGTRIEQNKIQDNADDGIFVHASGKVDVIDNRIRGNGRSGIFFEQCRGGFGGPCSIEGNRVTKNGRGALLYDSGGPVLDNTFSENAGDGLFVSDYMCQFLDGHRVGANLAVDNGGLGIGAGGYPASDGGSCESGGYELFDAGGNAASRNGDPRECAMFQVENGITCARNRGQAKARAADG